MTNREWLNSLSDSDLARFLSTGLEVMAIGYGDHFVVSISDISRRYIMSHLGIEEWLNKPQEFTIDRIF